MIYIIYIISKITEAVLYWLMQQIINKSSAEHRLISLVEYIVNSLVVFLTILCELNWNIGILSATEASKDKLKDSSK